MEETIISPKFDVNLEWPAWQAKYKNFSDEAFDNLVHEVAERPDKLKEVYSSIREWIEEFPVEFKRECRKEYLLEAIKMTKVRFFEACRMVVSEQRKYDEMRAFMKKQGEPISSLMDLILREDLVSWTQRANVYDKKLEKLNKHVKFFTGKMEEISPEKIERAREFPIEELVETKNGKAICPFHNDHHPSMDVRKNFYHCYTCQATGDVIDLVMHLENLTFKQAVERLSYSH